MKQKSRLLRQKPRNDGLKDLEMLKQVQHDVCFDRKYAFTLAETLITLVIIGVVAAIIVPSVMNNINSKQKEEKIKNVYHKLSKSTDKMLGVSGMNGYSSTEDFLNHFKNHLSIAKICKPENIQDCWGSKQITLKDGTKYDISNIKLPKDLRIPNKTNPGFVDIMGFVMNDGTPFIVSYNTECDMSISEGRRWLADKSSSTRCLAGIFDYNGGYKPNKLSFDVFTFNGAAGLGSNCAIDIKGTCYLAPQITATGMSESDCLAQKEKLGLLYCRSGGNDYYATAAKICGGKNNIASKEDLKKIADEMYPSLTIASSGWTYCNGVDRSEKCKDNDVALKYGLGNSSSDTWAWTSTETGSNSAYHRCFFSHGSGLGTYGGGALERNYSAGLVLCKAY